MLKFIRPLFVLALLSLGSTAFAESKASYQINIQNATGERFYVSRPSRSQGAIAAIESHQTWISEPKQTNNQYIELSDKPLSEDSTDVIYFRVDEQGILHKYTMTDNMQIQLDPKDGKHQLLTILKKPTS